MHVLAIKRPRALHLCICIRSRKVIDVNLKVVCKFIDISVCKFTDWNWILLKIHSFSLTVLFFSTFWSAFGKTLWVICFDNFYLRKAFDPAKSAACFFHCKIWLRDMTWQQRRINTFFSKDILQIITSAEYVASFSFWVQTWHCFTRLQLDK